jgi:hypothetical protein
MKSNLSLDRIVLWPNMAFNRTPGYVTSFCRASVALRQSTQSLGMTIHVEAV